MKILEHITIPDDQVERLITAHGPLAHAWIQHLPALVRRVVDCWDLVPLNLLHAGMESIVIAVEHPSGPCVLKLMVEPDDYHQQLHIMRSLAHHDFVPRIIAVDDPLHAILMERVDGIHPAQPGLVDDQIRAIVSQLSRTSIPGTLPLTTYWHGRSQRNMERCRALDLAPWQVELVERADPQMSQLITSSPGSFLHGDLHANNMFVTADDRVVLIDFWGMHGPPAYDIATWLAKTAHMTEDPLSRIANDEEMQWLAALLPSEALTVEHYSLGTERAALVWQLARQLHSK